MKRKTIFVIVILALALAACAPKLAQSMTSNEAPLAGERGPALDGSGGAAYDEGYAAMPTPAPASMPGTANQAALQERMVMMNADLTIIVADPQAEAAAITQMAQEMGGYVVSLQMYPTYLSDGSTVPGGTISVRIPQAKLESALNRIKARAVEVTNESRSGQDVTAQYVDLQSQLTNLERAEQDLLVIMDEARNNPGNDYTTKTQDVLNVYNQIVSIRGQIEQIKGQMKYYEDVTDTSLINVTLVAEETVQPIQIGPWSPKGTFNKAIEDLVNFWHGFVEFLIRFVIYVLPVVILIFGPITLITWAVVARLKRRKAKKAKAG